MSILAASPLPPNPSPDSPLFPKGKQDEAESGVLRWPSDPVLVGLAAAADPSSVARMLGVRDSSLVSTEVIAFRPTERAVVRVRTPTTVFYLKVVAPADVRGLIDRHLAARAAGVVAPVVRRAFGDLGIVVLEELAGPLLGDEIKRGRLTWPSAGEFNRLAQRIGHIDADLPVVPSRVGHAILHAGLLRSVDNEHAAHLDRLCEAFQSFRSDVEPQVIHGHLHDDQVVVHAGRITGVLDLDDLGIGSPLEERANLVGSLRFRAIMLPARHARISHYADHLRESSSDAYDRNELDTATAAVLVGLAIGPFRIQRPEWRATVSTLIECAASLLPTEARRPIGKRNGKNDVGGGNGGS